MVNGIVEIFGQIKVLRGRGVYLRAVLILQRGVRFVVGGVFASGACLSSAFVLYLAIQT